MLAQQMAIKRPSSKLDTHRGQYRLDDKNRYKYMARA
jgi:hypothetical protein